MPRTIEAPGGNLRSGEKPVIMKESHLSNSTRFTDYLQGF
jgi:hypothetical protein